MGRRAAAPSRFCTSIAADSLEGMVQKAELAIFSGTELVEFRIDRLMSGITTAEIGERLGRFARRAVMTVRTDREGGGFSGSEVERLRLLTSLARMRPAYLDVELSTAKENERWLGSLPKKVERIISWHDFEGTPDIEYLRRVCEEGLEHGTIAKVVTTATSVEDNLRTIKLCAENRGKVVSFCMGTLGTASRMMSMAVGAPVVYASLPDDPVAPGQISIATLLEFRGMILKG